MVVFEDVTSGVEGQARQLERVTLTIPSDQRIGIYVSSPQARSHLVQLLAGAVNPTSGEIRRYTQLSLPIASSSMFNITQSLRRNVATLARIFEADEIEVMSLVEATAEIGEDVDRPMSALSKESRIRASYCVGYALPFMCYLIDEYPALGGQDFRQRCLALLDARLCTQGVGIILISSKAQILNAYCDTIYAHSMVSLVPCEDVSSAVEMVGGKAHAAE